MDIKYTSKGEPEQCPACGSWKVAFILYGSVILDSELERRIQDGEIVLGGCIMWPDGSEWQCVDCKAFISRE